MIIKDVYPNDLIKLAAEKLKENENIKPPVWASFAKTGVHKERAPVEKDWWYMRVAAVLRSVYLLGPIGVSKLRTKYGGKKRRGHKPSHFRRGSGSVIRKVLQQLEKAELIKHVEIGVHKGRVITPAGKSLLDKTAAEIRRNMPKEEKAKEVVKKETPAKKAKVEVKEKAEVKEKPAPKAEVKKEEKKE